MSAIASRYARALVDVILEQKIDTELVKEQVNTIVQAVHESSDLRKVWESPAISAEQKRAVLDAIAREIGAFRPVRNFFAVLIDHHRMGMLDDIVRQFAVELDNQLGFAQAEISSARQLSPDERRELESRVEKLTGKKVRAQYVSNPELLGGVMIRVGSTIYDGSVRGQLERMRQELTTA